MDNQHHALLLLIGRLVVLFIMTKVIRKQLSVLKAKNYPELNQLRRTLLLGSIIIIIGNIVPIAIDVLGVFGKGSFGLLLLYVYSNNITAILSAYLLWYNIKLAEKIKLIDHKTLLTKDREIARLSD